MTTKLPSKTELLILSLLCDTDIPLAGMELMTKSDGRLKRGSVYVMLHRLEERGFVKTSLGEIGANGKPISYFEVTGEGRKAFGAVLEAKAIFEKSTLLGGVFSWFKIA